jgi:hypothetical protein
MNTMNIPGFTAEASVWRTIGRYEMGGATVQDDGTVHPAQQACPPRCIQECEFGCQRDGLSKSFCEKLCQSDCTAYGSGNPLQCSPCTQTCTYCGGVTSTRNC